MADNEYFRIINEDDNVIAEAMKVITSKTI